MSMRHKKWVPDKDGKIVKEINPGERLRRATLRRDKIIAHMRKRFNKEKFDGVLKLRLNDFDLDNSIKIELNNFYLSKELFRVNTFYVTYARKLWLKPETSVIKISYTLQPLEYWKKEQ